MKSKHTFNSNDKHVSQKLDINDMRAHKSFLQFQVWPSDYTYNQIEVEWDIKLLIKKLGSLSNCEQS